MAVEIDIRYEGDLHCAATHEPSGQTIATDAPVDNGGRGEAFSPTDLVAAALGACTVTIMGLMGKQKAWNLSGTRVHVTKEMVRAPARRIGALKVIITLPRGLRLSDADRAELENAGNLCPVRQSLHPDVNVVIEFMYPE